MDGAGPRSGACGALLTAVLGSLFSSASTLSLGGFEGFVAVPLLYTREPYVTAPLRDPGRPPFWKQPHFSPHSSHTSPKSISISSTSVNTQTHNTASWGGSRVGKGIEERKSLLFSHTSKQPHSTQEYMEVKAQSLAQITHPFILSLLST